MNALCTHICNSIHVICNWNIQVFNTSCLQMQSQISSILDGSGLNQKKIECYLEQDSFFSLLSRQRRCVTRWATVRALESSSISDSPLRIKLHCPSISCCFVYVENHEPAMQQAKKNIFSLSETDDKIESLVAEHLDKVKRVYKSRIKKNTNYYMQTVTWD